MQRRKERRHMTHPCHITELRTHDRPAPLRDPFLEQVDHYTDLFRQISAALPPEQAEAVEAIMCGPFYDGPHSPDAATQPVPPQPPRAERQRSAPPSPPPDGLRTPPPPRRPGPHPPRPRASGESRHSPVSRSRPARPRSMSPATRSSPTAPSSSSPASPSPPSLKIRGRSMNSAPRKPSNEAAEV